jgi:hypothetical protein
MKSCPRSPMECQLLASLWILSMCTCNSSIPAAEGIEDQDVVFLVTLITKEGRIYIWAITQFSLPSFVYLAHFPFRYLCPILERAYIRAMLTTVDSYPWHMNKYLQCIRLGGIPIKSSHSVTKQTSSALTLG